MIQESKTKKKGLIPEKKSKQTSKINKLRDLDSITSNLAVHILGEYKVSVRLIRVGQNSA